MVMAGVCTSTGPTEICNRHNRHGAHSIITMKTRARRLCLLGGALALSAGLGVGCAVPEDGGPRTSSVASHADGVCGSEPRQLPVGHSIRILSYNTQLLSPWFSW